MPETDRKAMLRDVKRIYTKTGSSILTGWGDRLDDAQFYHFARETSALYRDGIEIIHVTSGAIRTGMEKCSADDSVYGNLSMEDVLSMKQHFAGVGQHSLMEKYERAFKEFGLKVSQILLLSSNLKDPRQLVSFINCYKMHRRFNTIPIINNNDAISTSELGYSENDWLLADVVAAMESELPLRNGESLAINLSEHCLYDRDPRGDPEAKPIHIVGRITEEIEMGTENAGPKGSGGMRAKLDAAKRITSHGVPFVIADGRYSKGRQNIILSILEGDEVGTLFLPESV